MAAIYFHTTKNLRTDITVVEIAVHLPIDETFSECIKYKIRKKKGFFIVLRSSVYCGLYNLGI